MTTTVTSTRTSLATLGWVLLALAPLLAAGILLDPRVVDDAPAWLKPTKFAVSVGVFVLTLRWMIGYLTDWPRLTRVASRVTVVAFVAEMVCIVLQAARGTSSHFNTSTLFDGVVFGVMGVFIALQTLATLAVVVAIWRQPFADRALGWAMRLGLAISVAGASTGGLMTQPTNAQLARLEGTGVMPRAGAHTVGAEDGGAGLPGTGWSTTHGDLRVPHFLGLHAMQALPLLALVLGRQRRGARATAGVERAHVRLVAGAAVSYALLFAILLAQALRGQSVVAPAGTVLASLIVWAAGTAAFVATASWLVARAQAGNRPALEMA